MGTRDDAKSSIGDRSIRVVEVYLVEHVEHFRAELDLHSLAKSKILEYAEIRTVEGGAADQTAAGIAINAERQVSYRDKRRRVKECVHECIAVRMTKRYVFCRYSGRELGVLA